MLRRTPARSRGEQGTKADPFAAVRQGQRKTRACFFCNILCGPVVCLGFVALPFSHLQVGKAGHWSPSLLTLWPEHPLRCSRLLVCAGWGMISAVTLLLFV